jgi:arylsulfatase A-like enzyme
VSLTRRSAFSAIIGSVTAGQTRRSTPPNVLFIAVDDLRPELGIYGASHAHTPHLDALGRSGVTFTKAYCQQAVCNPSRASVLTGLRPDTLRVWDLDTGFRSTTPQAVTLPQRLRQQGYFATSMGKIFHNTLPDPASWSEPELRLPGYPFDPDAVYRSQSETAWIAGRQRDLTAQGVQQRYLDQYGEWYLKAAATEAPNVPDNAYFDGAQTDQAIAKLKQLQARRQPFFLGVGYYRPHLPFNVPAKYWNLYNRARIPLAPNPALPQGMPPMAISTMRELRGYRDFRDAPQPDQGSLTEAQARLLRHGYLASVSYIDAQVGRLLTALDRARLAENTVVVLWGDNGWKLGDHNAWCKMTNFEVDTRVPLIIRAPGVKGALCHRLVELVDIYPTVCELAGVRPEPHLEGHSLLPLLKNPTRPWKSAVFSQFLRSGVWVSADGVEYMGYCIRTAAHRYVEWVDWKSKAVVAHELYDLERDPQENTNIFHQPGTQTITAQLERQLRSGWRTAAPQPE